MINEFTRECLVLNVSRSFTSADLIEFLPGLFVAHDAITITHLSEAINYRALDRSYWQ